MSRILQINNHLKIINSSRYSFGVASHDSLYGLSVVRMPCLLFGRKSISTSPQVFKNSLRVQENLCYVRPRIGRKSVKKVKQPNVYSDLINVLDTRKADLSRQQIKRWLSKSERQSRLSQSSRSSIENKLENKSDQFVSQSFGRRRASQNIDSVNYGTVATINHVNFVEEIDSTTGGWRNDMNFFKERYHSENVESEFFEFDSQMIEHESFNSFSQNLHEYPSSQNNEQISKFNQNQRFAKEQSEVDLHNHKFANDEFFSVPNSYHIVSKVTQSDCANEFPHQIGFSEPISKFEIDAKSVLKVPKTNVQTTIYNKTNTIQERNISQKLSDDLTITSSSNNMGNVSHSEWNLGLDTPRAKSYIKQLMEKYKIEQQKLIDFQTTKETDEMIGINEDVLTSVKMIPKLQKLQVPASDFLSAVQNGIMFKPTEILIEAEDILSEFPVDSRSDTKFLDSLANFKKAFHVNNMNNFSNTRSTDVSFQDFRDKLQPLSRLSGSKTRSIRKPGERSRHKVESWMAFDKRQTVFDIERRQLANVACFAGLVKQITEEVKNTRENPIRSFRDQFKVTFPSTYNILINQNAKEKDIESVRVIYDILKEDKLEISYQTVAGYLECLGRMGHSADTYQHLQFILGEMKSLNLDIDELFKNCIFKQDERQFILKAIRQEKPNFKPSPLLPPSKYQGELLEELNSPPKQKFDNNPFAGVMSTEDLKKNFKRQVEKEVQLTVAIPSIAATKLTPKQEHISKKIDEVEKEWRETILSAFRKKLSTHNILNFENKSSELYPFLTILPEEEYVDLVLKEMTKLATCPEQYSPMLKYLCCDLGRQVYQRYLIEEKKQSGVIDKISRLYEKYLEEYNNPDTQFSTHRECWGGILNKHPDGPTVDAPQDEWIDLLQNKIGSALYDIILNDIKVDMNLMSDGKKERKMMPAVYSIYRMSERAQFLEIKMNVLVSKLYQEYPSSDITINTQELPMVAPPLPWLNTFHGGTVLSNVKLIRANDVFRQQINRVEELCDGELNAVYDSLNVLGACAWRINQPVLDIAINIFNDKGNAKLEIPPPQSELPTMKAVKDIRSMTRQERGVHSYNKNLLARQKAENWSLRSVELYRLSVANKYRNDVIWFPHNIDFRGRTYPTSPHLNHLGADISRGLLVFAKGRPLGPDGLNWLKIHLVNLTGLKKRSSNADRLAYAETLLNEVQDSADNPLTGRLWWQDCEEPWQVLACCMEITKAVRSPDHTKFISHFPVHQDGSCNGLQHYAALGRDSAGAESVNLCSFPVPQDVYSEVVQKVERLREIDAEKGIEIAKMLEGKVLRKTIKQTVMTTVYGVTRYGARQQISKQLEDISDFDHSTKGMASTYLVEKTFQSLKEIFSSTRNIQDWLCNIAEGIGRETNQAIEWITPLGLPVIQPYRSKTNFYFRIEQSNVDVNKQKNGFPPNFIHSLDSTHMMLTSLHCQHHGINFISVHDCFWTHACHVPIMNKITREQFHNLHKQPVIENLVEYLLQRMDIYQSNNGRSVSTAVDILKMQIQNIPKKGDFNIEKVLDSEYFFS